MKANYKKIKNKKSFFRLYRGTEGERCFGITTTSNWTINLQIIERNLCRKTWNINCWQTGNPIPRRILESSAGLWIPTAWFMHYKLVVVTIQEPASKSTTSFTKQLFLTCISYGNHAKMSWNNQPNYTRQVNYTISLIEIVSDFWLMNIVIHSSWQETMPK